jgi:hypothetical protein
MLPLYGARILGPCSPMGSRHHCLTGLLPLLVAAPSLAHRRQKFLTRMDPCLWPGRALSRNLGSDGSRSRRNNQFEAELFGPFGQRSDLLLAIPGFIVFSSFVDVLLSVFDQPVKEAR